MGFRRVALTLTLFQAVSCPSRALGATDTDVLRAWRKREAETASLRFTCDVEEVVMKRTRDPSGRSKDAEPLPKEDLLLRREFQYAVMQRNAIYSEEGQIWDHWDGAVVERRFRMNCIGEVQSSLYIEAGDPIPAGFVQAARPYRLGRDAPNLAITLIYRPLSQFLSVGDVKEDTLAIRDAASTPTPDGLVSVAWNPDATQSIILWTDPQRDYLPVRCLREHSGRLGYDLSIEYNNDGGTWVPSQWEERGFTKGELTHLEKTSVKEFEINGRLSDDLFKVEFPNGTWVTEIGRDDSEVVYLILNDGTRRYLSKDENDVRNYATLMRDGSAAGFRWLALVAVSVCALFVGVAFLGYRWRIRRQRA